jgi:hypothetical protein
MLTTTKSGFSRPSIRKAKPAETAPAPSGPRHRGVPYSVVQDPAGAWVWQVMPNAMLHAYDYAVAGGYRPTREAAELAARMAIDVQLDA